VFRRATMALLVEAPEIELRHRVSLVGGELGEPRGFAVIQFIHGLAVLFAPGRELAAMAAAGPTTRRGRRPRRSVIGVLRANNNLQSRQSIGQP
jgi:hypothetical protein